MATGQQLPWSLEMFDIASLWPRSSRGKGIKVAVCDTGAALAHPDFTDAIEDARDFTGSRTGPADNNGHGTWCAGAIGARDNTMGVVGVAPECTLLVAKVLGDNGG